MFKTTLKARLLAAATLTGAMMGGTAAWAQEGRAGQHRGRGYRHRPAA